eukprot:GSMAST32.ASY1.ANO1.1232.1 assembled CDS
MNLWITFGLMCVVVSAGLAAMGFRGREHVVGIDLGTTFSVIAVRKHDTGKLTTPSVVSYMPDGNVLVGHDAVPQRAIHPENTIFNAKRFLGRSYEDSTVQSDAKLHPFQVIAGTGTDAEQWVMVKKVVKKLIPEQIGTKIITKLLGDASTFLGHNQISSAVIAVPAEFNQRQKKATARAFEAAGLNVVRIVEEPTAAAIAYGLDRAKDIHNVIVFDLGGGTLDVSLLYVNNGSVQVINTSGNNHLGGEDFDQNMIQLIRTKIKNEQHTAEEAKRKLSFTTYTNVFCKNENDLLRSSTEPVSRVLKESNILVDEVDSVVMVGGGSRMPMIRNKIQEYLGGDGSKMNTHIDPDLAVAVGAAMVVD